MFRKICDVEATTVFLVGGGVTDTNIAASRAALFALSTKKLRGKRTPTRSKVNFLSVGCCS